MLILRQKIVQKIVFFYDSNFHAFNTSDKGMIGFVGIKNVGIDTKSVKIGYLEIKL